MRSSLAKISNEKKKKEYRRKLVIRKKVSGTGELPRLCAHKSNRHLFVQVIDDVKGVTLFSVQTFGENAAAGKANAEGAKKVGAVVADKLKKSGVSSVVFDRNGKRYTGVIAALADEIRQNGIKF